MTQRCNLSCTYCGSECIPSLMPINLDYSLNDLKEFFLRDEELPNIAFYGGEPLLELQKIREVIDTIKAKGFHIQTNGTLLKRLSEPYLRKLTSILISVDGGSNITNYYRGNNTYEKAIAGAIHARSNGFSGDLIARMTVSEKSDIYENVMHLLTLDNPKFDHVHWQLDAMWDDDIETRWDKFSDWLTLSYNPGITRLVEKWIETIERTGIVPGIVPFLGIMWSILTKNKTELRCGAGIDFFSITTNGQITVCPIPPSLDFAKVGDISVSHPTKISRLITLDEPCPSCEVLDLCGGRCIYTNKTKLWGDEGFDLVCSSTRHLIKEIQSILPKLENLIANGIVQFDAFEYPVIPNGVEIIP